MLNISEYILGMAKKWGVSPHRVLKGIKHLEQFGYLENDKLGQIADNIIEGVGRFQSVAGLAVIDGEIGPKTLRAMQRPRCGCPDAFIEEAKEAVRAWGVRELTWYVRRRDRDLSADRWDAILQAGLDQWSHVANLTFPQVYKIKEARLVFDIGNSQRESFGSQGGTLAWAYLPPARNYKGQLLCKFDQAETWTEDGRNGVRLLNVVCHEAGHLLGLGHSEVSSALMAPYYNISVSKPQANDDISRIQNIYGAPVEPKPTPKPEPTPSKLNIQIDGHIDKIHIPGYRISQLK